MGDFQQSVNTVQLQAVLGTNFQGLRRHVKFVLEAATGLGSAVVSSSFCNGLIMFVSLPPKNTRKKRKSCCEEMDLHNTHFRVSNTFKSSTDLQQLLRKSVQLVEDVIL